MNLKNKKILVTGAGGFIGSHLTETLVGLGADVKAFVRYNSRNDWGLLQLLPKDKLQSMEVISGDLRDCDAVRGAMKGTDIVFHLGSLIAIPYSYVHPRETIETNVIACLNVLMAARDLGTARVIHTSTSEVYGTARYVPIDEAHPLQGQSPYSASKIGADKVAESFYLSFDVPVVTIRPFNTFGPRQSARAVIPTIITQALGTDPQVRVGSLHPTRDYTFVADTVAAFIRAAEAQDVDGETINVGSGFEISIGDIAKKILALTGKNKMISQEEKRTRPKKSEVERLWCDNSKAKKLLGWQPAVDFDAGLKKTISWISANMDLFKSDRYNL